MRKIVPFNNVLNFNTDVYEVTAISLEHDIKKAIDTISGVFYITGEYKIAVGDIEKDKFSFELPFDIALGCTYNLDTLVVDIDDFRYELIDSNKLKVNIDLYIDGEVIDEENSEKNIASDDDLFTEEELRVLQEDEEPESKNEALGEEKRDNEVIEPSKIDVIDRIDLLDEVLKDDKEETMKEENTEINIQNDNDNINIFSGFNEDEKYVTYHVYPVTENDTLDKILEKYNVTKEELAKYNSNLDIHVGDKLIIPANHNDK